ncbi:flavin monoamine oxidase family protein [Streptomyces alanosinicus]|uniref:L-amino-acid oxidase YobN n=1 Tax=Streptomyces alanosinicus TaxID=68171 RepID=A0A918YU25_9ACTN|nr:FAD-dependent oxidoreductase [Streptomyces alanosinicus]GHE15228.1 putative L-amino-acid oxidase YobN [Streptomyces alanosinicus]
MSETTAVLTGQGPQAAPPPTGGSRILVLGAGIAGLVAAYELELRGHRVEVLEASTRIGGRVHTHRFGTGPTAPAAELGAMRIPAHHRRTLEYVRRIGLEGQLRPFPTLLSDENAFLPTSVGFVRVRDAARPLMEGFRRELEAHRPGLRQAPEVSVVGAWLTAVIDAIAPPDLRSALREDLRHQLLELLARVDVRPHMRGPGGDRVCLHSLFTVHPGLRAGLSQRLDSFLDDILTETGPALARLHGGMDQLPYGIARRLSRPVWHGHTVVGIDVGREGVRVHSTSGPENLTTAREADFAVCTLPFSSLCRVRLTGVDADKRAVLEEVEYCPATKVAFHCREPFWHAYGIESGASSTGGRIRQTYYPPVDGGQEDGAVLLASYTIGEEAASLGRLDPDRRHLLVLDELGALHPELLRPGMVLGAVSTVWGGDSPWNAGCTTRWGKSPAACESERARAARPVADRLFFAGEHCSTAPAWIEGAIESAVRAVDDLARAGSALPSHTAHCHHDATGPV